MAPARARESASRRDARRPPRPPRHRQPGAFASYLFSLPMNPSMSSCQRSSELGERYKHVMQGFIHERVRTRVLKTEAERHHSHHHSNTRRDQRKDSHCALPVPAARIRPQVSRRRRDGPRAPRTAADATLGVDEGRRRALRGSDRWTTGQVLPAREVSGVRALLCRLRGRVLWIVCSTRVWSASAACRVEKREGSARDNLANPCRH